MQLMALTYSKQENPKSHFFAEISVPLCGRIEAIFVSMIRPKQTELIQL